MCMLERSLTSAHSVEKMMIFTKIPTVEVLDGARQRKTFITVRTHVDISSLFMSYSPPKNYHCDLWRKRFTQSTLSAALTQS